MSDRSRHTRSRSHAARSRKRMLVAGTGEAIETLQQALGDEVELIVARSTAQALKNAAGDIDLIVCSVRFDGSRMFELLRSLKKRRAARAVPIVCCQLRKPRSARVRERIEMAMQSLGVDAFVDVYLLRDQYGDRVAQEVLRQVLVARMAGSGARLSGAQLTCT